MKVSEIANQLMVVFSGLYRFGYNSAATILHQTPDIAAYAKILTGGLLPLSTTLASKSIFGAFLSDRKVDALLHGHSYTANPIGCAVALQAMKETEKHEASGGWKEEKALWGGEQWSFWGKDFVTALSQVKGISGTMALGTVLAIELDDTEGGRPRRKTRLISRLLVARCPRLSY